jgi:hypothetical protein
LKIDL